MYKVHLLCINICNDLLIVAHARMHELEFYSSESSDKSHRLGWIFFNGSVVYISGKCVQQ